MSEAEKQWKTSVVTAQKRKEIASAFQRTHFNLATSASQLVTDESISLPQEAKPAIVRSSQHTSWVLGSDKPTLETENAERFRRYDVASKEEKPRRGAEQGDLYKQHFQLGYRAATHVSSSQASFPAPERLPNVSGYSKLFRETKLVLGDDKADFATETRSWLTPKHSDSKQLGNLMRTHKRRNEQASVWLGKHAGNIVTPVAVPRAGSEQRVAPVPQGTSVVLGTDAASFASSSHLAHNPVPSAKAEFQTALLHDLRRSHFTLGAFKEKEEGENTVPPQTITQKSPEQSMTYISNFELGNSHDKWESHYGWIHKGCSSANLVTSSTPMELATTSHVKLGNDSTTYKSTSHLHFTESYGRSASSLGRPPYPRRSHINLGNDVRDWSRVSQNYGMGAESPIQNQSFDNESRKHHFAFGYGKSQYVVSSKQEMPHRNAERAQLDEDTIHKLTGTSAQLAYNEERSFDSTYLSAYKWAHSQPDTEFQVSYN